MRHISCGKYVFLLISFNLIRIVIEFQICLIIAVAGGLRRDELGKLKLNDIQDKNDVLIITVPETKTGKQRIFTVTNKICLGINPIELFRKYLTLRHPHTNHSNFSLSYHKGKCSTQVVGIHTFSKIPCNIAKYLHLQYPEDYAGHCFRCTAASLLADTGADFLMLHKA